MILPDPRQESRIPVANTPNDDSGMVEAFGLFKGEVGSDVSLPNIEAARRYLRSIAKDPLAMRKLREGLARALPHTRVQSFDNHQFLKQVAYRLSQDPTALSLSLRKDPKVGGTSTPKKEPVETGGGSAAPQTIKPPETKAWVKFQVVDDDTNVPLGNVAIVVKDPAGWLKEYVTNSRGMVEIPKIDRGACGVSDRRDEARLKTTLNFVAVQDGEEIKDEATMLEGRPWKILFVENHKVKTGESILSLATKAGMTWQELSLFNWGTSVPDQINKHLANDVGCTNKVDKYNYRFDDNDDPGIMYIPTDWSIDGLDTDKTHIIRVNQVELAGIDIVIPLELDLDGDPLKDDEIRLRRNDGGYDKVVKSSEAEREEGVPLLNYLFEDVPPGEYTVSVKVGSAWNDVMNEMRVTTSDVFYQGASFSGDEDGSQFGFPQEPVEPVETVDEEEEEHVCGA